MESAKQFGPPPEIIQSIFNVNPEALEQIAQYMEQRGFRTPVSQVVGFSQFVVQPATTITATESTTSASYGDLATVGPELTTLGDGQYVFFFGASFFGESTGAEGHMALSINGATPSDTDGITGGGPDDASNANPPVSLSRVITATLKSGTNTVVSKYRSQVALTPASFADRWLIAFKYSNVR